MSIHGLPQQFLLMEGRLFFIHFSCPLMRRPPKPLICECGADARFSVSAHVAWITFCCIKQFSFSPVRFPKLSCGARWWNTNSWVLFWWFFSPSLLPVLIQMNYYRCCGGMHAHTADGSVIHPDLVRHFLSALSQKKTAASVDNPGILVWDIWSPDDKSMTIPVIATKENGQ